MIYTRFMLTPGVEWPDGDFTPQPSTGAADEAVEREGEGTTAFALMGFDPEGDRWEVLSVAYRPTTIVRRVRMMFGVDAPIDEIAWPIEFDRAYGIDAAMYRNQRGERVIVFGGLLSGMMAADDANPEAWCQARVVQTPWAVGQTCIWLRRLPYGGRQINSPKRKPRHSKATCNRR